jgi:prophage tail gpP-like protein
MNANGWRTMTVEDAERSIANGLGVLARLQADIDAWDAARMPIPQDVLSDYDTVADALSAFADEWGFDVDDVTLARDGTPSA